MPSEAKWGKKQEISRFFLHFYENAKLRAPFKASFKCGCLFDYCPNPLRIGAFLDQKWSLSLRFGHPKNCPAFLIMNWTAFLLLEPAENWCFLGQESVIIAPFWPSYCVKSKMENRRLISETKSAV